MSEDHNLKRVPAPKLGSPDTLISSNDETGMPKELNKHKNGVKADFKNAKLTLFFSSSSASKDHQSNAPLPPEQSCDMPKIQMKAPLPKQTKEKRTDDCVDLAIKDARKALLKETQTNPVEVNKRNQTNNQDQDEDIFPRYEAGQLKRAKMAVPSEHHGI